jgi:hypothetical protein
MEGRGFFGAIEAEGDADGAGEKKGDRDGRRADRRLPVGPALQNLEALDLGKDSDQGVV